MQQAARPRDFKVRSFSADDLPQTLELLRNAFGSWPGPAVLESADPEDVFRWKHLANPAGQSLIVLADAGDRLIGMRAYMPWPLHVDGTPVMARQAVDLATDPDHRGQGVNSALTRHAIESSGDSGPFTLGLPNTMSRSQSQKVGWRPVAERRLWVQVRRPLRVAGHLHRLKRPDARATTPKVDAPTVAECLSDREAVNELLQDARPAAERFATDWDHDHLLWRYDPLLANYRAVAEHDGGRLAGFAIFRLRRRGALWEVSVCELVVRPGDDRIARRVLRRAAGAARVDHVAAIATPGSTTASMLARAGFVRLPFGAMPFGVNLYRPTAPDPYLRESWALSLGDLERLQLC